MGENSKIEWTHHTWNPWSGCAKVSPGCAHCYAEALAARAPKTFGQWGKGAPRRRTTEAYWKQPAKWNRAAEQAGERRRVFCASLADWLDDEVPVEWLADWIFGGNPPRNVWIGASTENQAMADERIPLLVAIPARVRFLSCEPLIGPVTMAWANDPAGHVSCGGESECSCKGCHEARHWPRDHTGERAGIQWVIVGGESGPGARPMKDEWVRQLQEDCNETGTAFFFKQWGGIRKKDTGRLLDGRTYDDLPSPTEDFDPTVYFEEEPSR